MKLSVGTKSLLFGVHQIFWHPFTVLLAWLEIYREWPSWIELVAIVCHDLAYAGCSNMDGKEGRKHPIGGAEISYVVAQRLSYFGRRLRGDDSITALFRSCQDGKAAWQLSIGHSRYYAKESGVKLSKLFRADKCSILFEPEWFYLLRARLSGELLEYLDNAPLHVVREPREWLKYYKGFVIDKFL